MTFRPIEKQPPDPPYIDMGVLTQNPVEVWVTVGTGETWRSDGFETGAVSWVEETNLETMLRLSKANPVDFGIHPFETARDAWMVD